MAIKRSALYHAGFKNDVQMTAWSRDRGKVHSAMRKILLAMSPGKRKTAKVGIQSKRFLEPEA